MPDSGAIRWPELIVLMCFGSGEPESGLRGVVHVREVSEHADDSGDDPPDGEVPGVGPVRVRESSHRVFKRGELVRRERLDGRPMAIFGAETRWIWLDAAQLPTAFAARTSAWGWPDWAVVERPSLRRWEGTDFARPTGPIRPTTLLGRPAWVVELAPPAHKPFPITLVVDAETGIVLQQRNDGFGSVTEWTELSFDADVPDDLFTWTGPVLDPPDRSGEHERQMALRREWLKGQGIGAMSLRVDVEFMPHHWDDDTGEFEASVEFGVSGALLRRRRSELPWDTRNNWPHNLRWSDDDWDWYFGSRVALSEEQLADFRRQLGSAPSIM